MKHELSDTSRNDRWIERAARCRDKMGKGEISTGAFASILAHPGEPNFPETGIAGIGSRTCAILHRSDLCSPKTLGKIQTRVEFSIAACKGIRLKRRTHPVMRNM